MSPPEGEPRRPGFAARTDWDLRPNAWARGAERLRGQAGVLDLTVTNPTTVGLEYPRRRILAALAQSAALEYHPQPLGAGAAREAVAAYYAARGAAVPPGQVVLTSGTSEAYSFLFRLLAEPAASAHVPLPSYPLLDHLAAIQDVKLVPYPLWYAGEWQADMAELERAVTAQSRLLVTIHPNNPTGSYLSAAEWRRMTDLAARHGLALVADEVFFDYGWNPASCPLDLAGAADEDGPPVFLLNGLSKISGLPQMKLGWMAVLGGGAAWRRQALERLEVMADAYLSVSTPAQTAAPELLAVRREMQPLILTRLRGNLAELDRQITTQNRVARLAAAGGWMAVLRLPAGAALPSGQHWAEAAQAAGVLAHPGEFYGFCGGAYLVLSLLTPPPAWAEGVSRLLELAVRAAG